MWRSAERCCGVKEALHHFMTTWLKLMQRPRQQGLFADFAKHLRAILEGRQLADLCRMCKYIQSCRMGKLASSRFLRLDVPLAMFCVFGAKILEFMVKVTLDTRMVATCKRKWVSHSCVDPRQARQEKIKVHEKSVTCTG
jgi:hypothetical protein